MYMRVYIYIFGMWLKSRARLEIWAVEYKEPWVEVSLCSMLVGEMRPPKEELFPRRNGDFFLPPWPPLVSFVFGYSPSQLIRGDWSSVLPRSTGSHKYQRKGFQCQHSTPLTFPPTRPCPEKSHFLHTHPLRADS